MSVVANEGQALRWNGESGRYRIAHRERHQMIRQRLPRATRAASR